MELAGRVVVVTGAASGIGAALADRFGAEGAKVVAADLDGDRLAGIGTLQVVTDVADRTSVRALVDTAEAELGPVDLFFANAGILVAGDVDAPVEQWQRAWEVNVLSHVHAAAELVPRWLERGGGYLCVTASAAGLLTQVGAAPYSVTKHAAVGFAEWLAITHGDAGIRVSILCPQAVNTPMAAPFGSSGMVVGEVLEPSDVADVAVTGIREERLYLLPHPEVAEYVRRRAEDPERWVRGMRRLAASVTQATPPAPQS